jgi:hypothetical protein
VSANLDALRTEYEQLSLRMNRVAILTLTAVLLLVLGLTDAIQEVRESSDYRSFLDLQRREDAAEVDRALLLRAVPGWGDTSEAGKLREQIGAAATKAYTREVSLLGAKANIDLRQVLLVLPAILLAAALYLLVLWFKREAVQRIGEHALTREETPTDVDCLYFGAVDTAYAEYPGRLGWWSFLIAMSALLWLLASVASSIWSAWDVTLSMSVVAAAAFVTACAVLYVLSAGFAIDDQAAARIGRPLRGNVRARVIARVAALRQWLATVRRAKILGLSASSLVLLSLVLPLGYACENFDSMRTVPGWEIVSDPFEMIWLTLASLPRNYISIAIYFVTLLLAVVTVVTLVIWFRRGVPQRLAVVMLSVATVCAAYVAADTGFFYPLAFGIGGAFEVPAGSVREKLLEIPVPLFLVTTVVATIFHRRRRIASLRRRALMPFVPVVISALAAGAVTALDGMSGYAAYMAGLFGLTIAWYGLTQPSSAESTGVSDL